MTAIAAQFVKLMPVPTRKVVQLVFEAPEEKADEILAGLGGYPRASEAKWAGIALLNGVPTENTMKGGKLAQRAGILCNEGGFQRFCDASNPDEATQFIYQHCGVTSRAYLDHDEAAARAFRAIELDYKNWLNGVAA